MQVRCSSPVFGHKSEDDEDKENSQARERVDMSIEELLEKPYWIVDILPMQVPANAGGQYFKVEQFYLKRMPLLRQKYAEMLLKLNCYFHIRVSHDGEEWVNNPEPESFGQWVDGCKPGHPAASSLFVSLMPDEVLLVMQGDSTYMTVYNPTEEVLSLICQLATSEGLFVWQPSHEADGCRK